MFKNSAQGCWLWAFGGDATHLMFSYPAMARYLPGRAVAQKGCGEIELPQ